MSEQILKEYNTGLALHKTFFENADGKPLTNKVKFEILNNAIEKVTMTQPSSPEIQELKDTKQVALDGFVDQVKMTESKVIKDVMEKADIATKGKILSVVANNVVAEKANKNDVVQEIAEKEEDKGTTVSLDNFGVVEKEEQKTFASLILEEPRVQEKDATQDESLKGNENEQASDVTRTRPNWGDEFIADAKRSIADAESILNQFKQHIAEGSAEVKSKEQREYEGLRSIKDVKLLKEVLHFEKEINSTNEIEEVYQKFQEEVDASQRSESKDKIGEIIRDEEELENSEKVDER